MQSIRDIQGESICSWHLLLKMLYVVQCQVNLHMQFVSKINCVLNVRKIFFGRRYFVPHCLICCLIKSVLRCFQVYYTTPVHRSSDLFYLSDTVHRSLRFWAITLVPEKSSECVWPNILHCISWSKNNSLRPSDDSCVQVKRVNWVDSDWYLNVIEVTIW